jgi:hypothetical protein
MCLCFYPRSCGTSCGKIKHIGTVEALKHIGKDK